jgi:hypothetical protein
MTGNPEGLVGVPLFFAYKALSYVTGQILAVDGEISAPVMGVALSESVYNTFGVALPRPLDKRIGISQKSN